MPDEEYVTRKEYNTERTNINNKLSEHDKKIAELQTICNNLKGVPNEISSLRTDMAVMGEKLTNITNMLLRLDKDFKDYIIKEDDNERKQDGRISEIDSKSKIDIIDWLKENWVNIVVGVSMGLLVAKNFVK